MAGVCLYIACRLEKTPHLLIDFSDVLKVNVYKLGCIYLKLVERLFLDVPQIDPSLYINRYCSRLEFDTKKNQVAMTALRLLQSMKRAWISTGRRPNGLCGAAILIAARYHGFKRNLSQIVRVVHVCQETIRKRLDEFKFTNTAKLTREEFAAIESTHEPGSAASVPPELEETMDPPCFIRNQSKRILEIEDGLDDIHKMIEQKASKIEQKLEKYEHNNGGTLEEEKDSGQLVPYNPQLLQPSETSTTVATLKRELSVPPYQSSRDADGVISLSDVDDEEIEAMILTEEESRLKKVIWDNLNKDWIKDQRKKKRERKERRKIQENSNRKKKKAKPKGKLTSHS